MAVLLYFVFLLEGENFNCKSGTLKDLISLGVK